MTTETKPKRFYMETVSGRYLNLIDPDPETIILDDIALALSNTCRWAGHCPYFYSVAEHACLVYDILVAWGEHPLICAAGLHHDDHEAFIGDLATPVKMALEGPGYRNLADCLDRAIARALVLDVDLLTTPKVKRADQLALFVEAQEFKRSQGRHWNDRPAPPEELVRLPHCDGVPSVVWAPIDCGKAMTPAEAYNEFLLRAEQ